ncbi:MAG: 23S rRNA (adenine(2503)-C(2))-methyltransferase RlmN [Chlorobiota bacterium]|nr:MAG: 23S rRNA (adenine(2503)-C(2))-methyltransferase RlmN [Chlorobiota bacterium]
MEPILISINEPQFKEPIIGKNREDLIEVTKNLGQPSFRSNQLYEWIYSKRTQQFDLMTNLGVKFIQELQEKYSLQSLKLIDSIGDKNDTVKFLFRTFDNLNIEAVLIPSESRNDQNEPRRKTICISTQVGCPLDCKFCATASMKMKRNLLCNEIIEQIFIVEKFIDEKITNIVYMGMGEPMLNYNEVFKSISIITDPKNKMCSPKRITVSTSGLVDGIIKMADENQKVKLALSLHALTDGLRSKLMPINLKYNLKSVMNALEYYYQKTRETVTFEYILFEGLNDTQQDVKRLTRLSKRFPTKVNVIPFHPIEFINPVGFSSELKPTSVVKFNEFISDLKYNGVQVMVRSSSGKDINAACGQLAITHDKILLSEK